VKPSGIVLPDVPAPQGFTAQLLCWTRLRDHFPQMVVTPLGIGYRCGTCGKSAATAGELMRINDYVSPYRSTYERDGRRMVRRVA